MVTLIIPNTEDATWMVYCDITDDEWRLVEKYDMRFSHSLPPVPSEIAFFVESRYMHDEEMFSASAWSVREIPDVVKGLIQMVADKEEELDRINVQKMFKKCS